MNTNNKKSQLPDDDLIEELEEDALEEEVCDDEELEEDLEEEEEEEEEEELDEEEEIEEDDEDSSCSPSNAPSVEDSTDSGKEKSVADGMFSDKINKLISIALVDGKITDAERSVLMKKAMAEGIDEDEFEMVLEAMLYEHSQSTQNAQPEQAQAATPKQEAKPTAKPEKSKTIKCGACGAMLQSFQTNCPECGTDVNINSGGVVLASIKQLFEALDSIESSRRYEDKTKKNLFQKIFSFDVVDDIAKHKMECIKNFPVPTTKEDILEFLCMAVPLTKKRKLRFWSTEDEENIVRMHNLFVPIWKSKCEQIIMKARFAMKNDAQTLKSIEKYASELEK